MKVKITRILLSIILAAILFFTYNLDATALTTSSNFNDTSENLVNKILGTGIKATNISKSGTVYEFSNGLNDFGIESGIILDTSGSGQGDQTDSDLAALMDYSYGGHTSSLEFTMTAKGSLLNFNYVFASGEFKYGPNYNDVFGLFVSVNNGPYENIAKIENDNGDKLPVNITNLKANPNLYSKKSISINGETTDGVSNVFNAQKKVNKDDIVKVKFVIADVTDTSVNSYVMIEAGSLSFDAPGANLDYSNEKLQNLEPNTTYKIIDNKNTYELTSDDEGKIPLVGKDNNNENYNFIGKELQIIKKGIDNIPDSEPQDIVIDGRPNKPENVAQLTNAPNDIDVNDIEVTETEIRIIAKEGQEYSIDNNTWYSPNQDGYVIFNNLQPNKKYEVYTRYKATTSSLASDSTSGTEIVTKNMVKSLNYSENNYEGEYDGNYHYAYITSEEDVNIKYSKSLNGTYTNDVIRFKKTGIYTIYYAISKEGYYSAYGTLTVKITGKGIIDLLEPNTTSIFNPTIRENINELASKIDFTEDELGELNNSKNIDIYLEVNDISNKLSKEEKELIKNSIKLDDNIGIYLDISLFKKVEGHDATKITKTKKPIKVSFKIPENLLNTNSSIIRTFKIFRLHDGIIKEIEVNVDKDIVTFETDEFSTYTLAYTDKVNPNNPATGDNILIYIILLGTCLIVLVSIIIYQKIKRK